MNKQNPMICIRENVGVEFIKFRLIKTQISKWINKIELRSGVVWLHKLSTGTVGRMQIWGRGKNSGVSRDGSNQEEVL